MPQQRQASPSEWVATSGRPWTTATAAEHVAMALPDVFAVLIAVAVLPRPAAFLTGLAFLAWGIAGLYRRKSHLAVLDDLPALSIGIVLALDAVVLVGDVALSTVALVGAMMLAIVTFGRMAAYALIHSERRSGTWVRETVVVGTGDGASALIERIQERSEAGLVVGAVLGSRPGLEVSGLRTSGQIADLPALITNGDFQTVIVGDTDELSEAELADVVRSCAAAKVEVFVLPRLPELYATRRGDDQVWGVPLRRVAKRWTPARRAAKRILDVMLTAPALIVLSPLLLVVALMVRLDGPGVLFRQERIGRNGRPFQLLKFRTMRPLAEGETAAWAADKDRYGRYGEVLRRFSLDELPQLLNVLHGDMSLVGPRPERPEYVALFGAQILSYRHRHRVTVGLTGLAAVEGLRGDSSIDERAHFDNWYIENWSLWLDIKVLVRTVTAVVRGSGA